MLRLRRQTYQQVVRTGDFVKKTQENMGTPVAADAPWNSSPLLESSCPKPSPAGQARPATSIHTCAPNVRPFSSRSPHKEDLVLLRPRRPKYSAGREDRRFCEENPGEDGHTCGSRCTLEQLATARVPHLDWLALPDHCFTAAKTAKRTQKQVCPHAPRSGAKCCGRNACREAQGGSPAR